MRLPQIILWLSSLSVVSLISSHPDVYYKKDLDKVIRDVAKGNQIILFTYKQGDKIWLDMTLQLAYSLDKLKYPYVVLTHDSAACDDLRGVYCIQDSVLRKTRGYGDSVESLWVRRYHACALFAAAGIGVTLLDADSIITRDFLPLLVEYEKEYSLVVMREFPANGGVWHLRASNESSAGLWVIKQIERRSTLYTKYKVRNHDIDPGLRMDQDELGDVLRVATSPNGSAFDFFNDFLLSRVKDHQMWIDFPQKQPSQSFEWLCTEERYSSPFATPTSDSKRTALRKKYELVDVPLLYHTIRIPFDSEAYDETAPPEKVLVGPNWLWSHGDLMMDGHLDEISLYHLLRIKKIWGTEGTEASSHAGRHAQWMVNPGMPSYEFASTNKSLVALSQDSVDKAAKHPDESKMKKLIKHFFVYAYSNGAMPVMPQWSCSLSPWLKVSETSLCVDDHRVIFDSHCQCTPSPGGEFCFAGKHFYYKSMIPALEKITEIGMLPPTSGTKKQTPGELISAKQQCPDYFFLA